MQEIDDKFAELIQPIAAQFAGRPLTSTTMAEVQFMCRQVEHNLKELFYDDFEVVIGLDEVQKQLVVGYRSRIPSETIFPPTQSMITGFERLLKRY